MGDRDVAYGVISEIRRRVGVEARAWGLLTALTNAFAAPLLVARGADVTALGVYIAGVSLFGLGAASLGPVLARCLRDVARPAIIALLAGRLALLSAALVVFVVPDGAAPALIAALLLWSAGEGIALPLWTTFVAGLAGSAERGAWLSWRATIAAGAVAATLPPLVLLAAISPVLAWQAAFAIAAIAGLVSVATLHALFRAAPPPPPPPRASRRWSATGAEGRFLLAVFCFWFGATLNRPVLPPYLIHDLSASPAYFAAAAAVTALAGLIAQRWWGRQAETRRTRALLGFSGLGASATPVLWTSVPIAWAGLPVEALAAGCWLGHLLGLALRAAELAHEDAERPALMARVHVAQGSAATLAPLGATAVVAIAGARPILIASGLVCLVATALLAELKTPAWIARLGAEGWGWSLRRGG